MRQITEAAAETMRNLRAALDGAKSFDEFMPKTPEERAQMEADDLNRIEGKEHEKDGYSCDKCRNRGYYFVANGSRVEQTRCDCWKARHSLRRMKASGLGNVIQKYTFARYQVSTEWQKIVKETALAFLADDSAKCFFIGGCSGGGKSHICTAICRNLLAENEVHYMLWETECPELKSNVTNPDVYGPRMKRLKDVDVLYIDDFFSGYKMRGDEVTLPSDADIRLAREIINHRHANGKRTIVSSEWYSDDIFGLSDALGGRIKEDAGNGKYCLNIARDPDNNYRLKMGGEPI